MNRLELTTARSHAYGLFAQLFAEGITAELLPHLESIPDLAAHLVRPFDAEQAAVEFHNLFHFNVFPYEGIFRDETPLLGGATSQAVGEFYRSCGYRSSGESADHIGEELSLLAFLCGAEADAWEDGEASQAARVRTLQSAFFAEHALVWMPALAFAIRQQNSPFFAAVADLTLDLILDHHRELRELALDAVATPTLPEAPDLLGEARTGLRDIASFFLTPAFCGFYLSRDDIGRLGRQFGLPRGFGDRQTMLHNLLRSAATYEQMPALIEAIGSLVQSWRRSYESLAEPELLIARPWLQRLQGSLDILTQLYDAVPDLSGDPSATDLGRFDA
ncbi:MAG: molecular chaperone TorD family protein [Caldilineales bacterium]|nr:molecular chaperone TorD family protein [Caldilineales bacterium]